MISPDKLDRRRHIRNCRGQLATKLSPLSVGLFYYDIFALFGSKFCFDRSACKLARANKCTFIMTRQLPIIIIMIIYNNNNNTTLLKSC